jgi:hypothetical protein
MPFSSLLPTTTPTCGYVKVVGSPHRNHIVLVWLQPRRCVLFLLCLTYNLLNAGLGHARVVLAILDHDMFVCPCQT